MAKMNVWKQMVMPRTHEGAVAQRVSAKAELRRTVLTCLLWEETFYEKGNDIAQRVASLVRANKAEDVAALAVEARSEMQLRHVPLFLVRELARRKGAGALVADPACGRTGRIRGALLEGKEAATLGGREARAGTGLCEVRRVPACEV